LKKKIYQEFKEVVTAEEKEGERTGWRQRQEKKERKKKEKKNTGRPSRVALHRPHGALK
jgi:hypothetical protein